MYRVKSRGTLLNRGLLFKVSFSVVALYTLLVGVSCGKKTYSELHGIKKELCACKTNACVTEVYAKMATLNEPPDSKERRAELLDLMSQMDECAKSIVE